jgi:hypothetical protein
MFVRVFENRVLRSILGPKRYKVTEEWKKLHHKELNDLYSSPIYYSGDQIEKNVMGGTCSTYRGEDRRFRFWRGNLRGGDLLGDPGVYGK